MRADRWPLLDFLPGQESRAVVAGTRVTAVTVVSAMLADRRTIEEAACDRGLSVEAVRQAVDFCKAHERAIRKALDADWERMVETGLVRG